MQGIGFYSDVKKNARVYFSVSFMDLKFLVQVVR